MLYMMAMSYSLHLCASLLAATAHNIRHKQWCPCCRCQRELNKADRRQAAAPPEERHPLAFERGRALSNVVSLMRTCCGKVSRLSARLPALVLYHSPDVPALAAPRLPRDPARVVLRTLSGSPATNAHLKAHSRVSPNRAASRRRLTRKTSADSPA